MTARRSNGCRHSGRAWLQRAALCILLTNALLESCGWLLQSEHANGSASNLQASFSPLQGFRFVGVAAAPVSAPNVFSCTGSCCPPKQSPKLWSPPLQNGPLRTRLSFQTAFSDPAYVSKYKLAYQRLRELQTSNASDPRGWLQQANVHCAYCSNTYGMDIHRTWLFFPWHRWYLYFHERILGQLIGDPTFTLPFWNWDSAAGRAIPAPFLDKTSPIYNANRNNLNSLTSQITSSCSIPQMQSAMLDAQTTSLFLGTPPGTRSAGGSVELGVHGAVHVATGLQSSPYIDMGSLASAGKDALFYAHHLNIDRLWWLWLQLPPAANGNPRANPTSADWLNSQFAFYDENAQLTIVSVKDAGNLEQSMGVTYEAVQNDWYYAPTPSPSPSPSAAPSLSPSPLPSASASPLPSPSPSPSPSKSPAPSQSAAPSPSGSPAASTTPSPVPSPSPSRLVSPSPSASSSPAPSNSPAPSTSSTSSPSKSPNPSPSSNPSPSLVASPSPAASSSALPSPSSSAYPSPSASASPSPNPSSSTNPSPSGFATPSPSTSLAVSASPASNSPLSSVPYSPLPSPSISSSPAPSVSTAPSSSSIPSPSNSPPPSNSPSPIPSASPVASNSPLQSPSSSPLPSTSGSPAPLLSPLPSSSSIPFPSNSPIPSIFPSPVPSASPAQSNSPIPSLSNSPVPSPSNSPVPSPSNSLFPSPSASSSPAIYFSPNPSNSATPSPSKSPVPSNSPSPVASSSPAQSNSPLPSHSTSPFPSPPASSSPNPSSSPFPSSSSTPSPSFSPVPSPSNFPSPSAASSRSPSPSVSAQISPSVSPHPSSSANPPPNPSTSAYPRPSNPQSPAPSASPAASRSPAPSSSPRASVSPRPSVSSKPSSSPRRYSNPKPSPSSSPKPSPVSTNAYRDWLVSLLSAQYSQQYGVPYKPADQSYGAYGNTGYGSSGYGSSGYGNANPSYGADYANSYQGLGNQGPYQASYGGYQALNYAAAASNQGYWQSDYGGSQQSGDANDVVNENENGDSWGRRGRRLLSQGNSGRDDSPSQPASRRRRNREDNYDPIQVLANTPPAPITPLPGGSSGRGYVPFTSGPCVTKIDRPQRPPKKAGRIPAATPKPGAVNPVVNDTSGVVEVLVIQGLCVPMNTNVTFQVYLELPQATARIYPDDSRVSRWYVGQYVHVPMMPMGGTGTDGADGSGMPDGGMAGTGRRRLLGVQAGGAGGSQQSSQSTPKNQVGGLWSGYPEQSAILLQGYPAGYPQPNYGSQSGYQTQTGGYRPQTVGYQRQTVGYQQTANPAYTQPYAQSAPGYQTGYGNLPTGYQAGYQPGYAQSYQSAYGQVNQQGYQPLYQPGYQPGNQPLSQLSYQSGYQAGYQPGSNSVVQPGVQSGNQLSYQPGYARSGANSGQQSSGQTYSSNPVPSGYADPLGPETRSYPSVGTPSYATSSGSQTDGSSIGNTYAPESAAYEQQTSAQKTIASTSSGVMSSMDSSACMLENVRYCINRNVMNLGIVDASTLTVVLVPVAVDENGEQVQPSSPPPVTFENISIEFE